MEKPDLLSKAQTAFSDNYIAILNDLQVYNEQISNIDDFLDLKWNCVKRVFKKLKDNGTDININDNEFNSIFDSTSNYKGKISSLTCSLPSFVYILFTRLLSVIKNSESIKKVELNDEVIKNLSNNSQVTLGENNDLVKVFKAIYYWAVFPSLEDTAQTLITVFNNQIFIQELLDGFFTKEQKKRFFLCIEEY